MRLASGLAGESFGPGASRPTPPCRLTRSGQVRAGSYSAGTSTTLSRESPCSLDGKLDAASLLFRVGPAGFQPRTNLVDARARRDDLSGRLFRVAGGRLASQNARIAASSLAGGEACAESPTAEPSTARMASSREQFMRPES